MTDQDETIQKQELESTQDEKQYPSQKVVLLAMAALWLAFFLVALERTIIGTAIPAISRDFNSFGDIAWYEAGFLLPLSVLQLSFGLLFKYHSTKWLLAIMIVVFEVGSIVCAAAPTSKALIVGRVITGIGGAGIGQGAFLMITYLVPLQSRPKYIGAIGSVFGISSAIGPILGGYLTSVSWRWCFWINVPVGVVSLVVLVWLAPKTPPYNRAADTWTGKLKQLDPLGFILIAPAVICLLFALEWGGTVYAWSNGRIIALFVVGGVLGAVFIASQFRHNATVPRRIVLDRSILAATFAYLGIGGVMVLLTFYLPIWFQVIQGKTPAKSGLSLIPLFLSVVTGVICTGPATSLIGYYTPLMLVGSAILIVGCGLITTWQPDSAAGIWIGYQVVAGIGLGVALLQPNVAVQTVLNESDLSVALSLLNFVNYLGGSVFITTSQTLLENRLISGLRGIVPNLDANTLRDAGATAIRSLAPKGELPLVLDIYNNSIKAIWYLALGLSCLSLLASIAMPWRSVKSDKKKKNAEEQGMSTTAISEEKE